MKKFCLVTLSLVALVGCRPRVTPEAAIDAALVPGADFYAYQNIAVINASAVHQWQVDINTKIQNILAQDDQNPNVYDSIMQLQALAERLGLAPDNLDQSVVSAAFATFVTNTIPLFNERNFSDISFDDLRFIAGLTFKQPISPNAPREFFDDIHKRLVDSDPTMADDIEKLHQYVTVSDFSHGNAAGVNITLKGVEENDFGIPADKVPTFSLALLANGRALYMGFQKDVNAAIDRANAGEKAALSAGVQKLLDTPLVRHDSLTAVVVPPVLSDVLMRFGNPFDDDAIPVGLKPVVNAVMALQGVCAAATYGDEYNGTLTFVFDTPERAVELKDYIQINVLGLLKMALFQFIGQNTACAESLVATVDGNAVTIHCNITAADLDVCSSVIEKWLATPDLDADE